MNDLTNNTSVEAVEETAQEEAKTYTQEEVFALLQSEADKRVTAALKKQQKQYEKQLSQQNTLLNLDKDKQEEARKEMRIAELEEQLAQYQTEKNRSELKSVLSSRGLSAEFADIIAIGEDIEAAQANIDKLDKLFKAAVKAEIEKRLAGNAPKGNGATAAKELTLEEAVKLPAHKLRDLELNNPELFYKLFN